jgi:hypothetical protein
MYKNITQSDFIDSFVRYGRKDQFSHSALVAIFNFMEENDPNQELDVIAICTYWSEYTGCVAAANDHGQKFTNEQEQEAFEWLSERCNIITDLPRPECRILISNF